MEYKKKSTMKYKTEICKNWEVGYCEFEDECVFAHGKEDIRGKSSYKTKKCRQFFEQGYCMFGNKCIFQHFEGLDLSIESDNNYTFFPNNFNESYSKTTQQKPRLPIFQQICQNNQD
ncbi:hypothetical protein SteCoe_25142 [Stentor coeruleus]|uniref:C3H1-type domain-containing protein n=1 Tax=Stentor coeruleus TaxID=5963 RepID=A0A1R2BFW8_9CILI|nr:hypothetical protein SteCoe_25142 [Stentor coeruleus]